MPDRWAQRARAGAAQLLLQQPTRRMPDLHGPRLAAGRGRRPDRARPFAVSARGRDRRVEPLAVLLSRAAGVGEQVLRHRHGQAVVEAREAAAERAPERHGREEDPLWLQESVRALALVRGAVRGCGREPAAPLRGDAVRVPESGARALHVGQAMPCLQGQPAQARVPRGLGKRAQHRRRLQAFGEQGDRVLRPHRHDRARGSDRARHPEGDSRAAAVHDRRRPRLPDDRARGQLAERRRVAAHPAGDPDRLQADGRALHPRRAVDRAAPAGQPPPDQHAGRPARPRQHPDRGRARRGDHPLRGLHGRHRARRRRARRRDRGRGTSGQGASRPALDHGRVPARRPHDPGAGAAAQGQRQAARDPRRAGEQPQGHRRHHPARNVRRRVGRQRLREVVPDHRHPQPQGGAALLPCEGKAGTAQGRGGAGPPRQGDRHRPVADRAHATQQPGDLHGHVHAHPRPVREHARGEDARLQGGPVQFQRQGRAMRGVPGRRHHPDRDAVPPRRVRALRGVPRHALLARGAGGQVPRALDLGRAGDDRRRGARGVRERARDQDQAADSARRRSRVHPSRPARDPALGR